jgi:hypothetical protein
LAGGKDPPSIAANQGAEMGGGAGANRAGRLSGAEKTFPLSLGSLDARF